MVISDKFKKELNTINKEIEYILRSYIVTDYRLENFFKSLEKVRYNLLNEIKTYNNNVEFEQEKLCTIDAGYNAQCISDTLKIYIPETLLSFKHIKTHTYKRILLNVAEITKLYKGLFREKVFIIIKIFDNYTGWDVDNRTIKPIADGLIASGVIDDDRCEKMFYCVKGEYSDNPHTEVTIVNAENINIP